MKLNEKTTAGMHFYGDIARVNDIHDNQTVIVNNHYYPQGYAPVEEEEAECSASALNAKRKGRPRQSFESCVTNKSETESIRSILKEILEKTSGEEAFRYVSAAVHLGWLRDYPAHPLLKREFGIAVETNAYSTYKQRDYQAKDVDSEIRHLQELKGKRELIII